MAKKIFYITALFIYIFISPSFLKAGGHYYEQSQRIISLSPGLTEICYMLGIGDQLIGVTKNAVYPPEAQKKQNLGKEKHVNVNKIILLRPNLVLASTGINNPYEIQKMIKAGVTVKLSSSDSLSDIFTSIKNIGKWTNRQYEAKKLTKNLKSRIAIIKSIAKKNKAPKALLILNTNPLITCRRGSLLDEILKIAGADNIATNDLINNPFPDIESLAMQNPDVIIEISITQTKETYNKIYRRWAKWKNIPAVKNGKIYILPAEPFITPGPRLIDGLEMIAAALYPDKNKEILSSTINKIPTLENRPNK
ncbi:ABC transporter substrate-binding protein [bacterium]|nr:ABC transporter substrate-binding protein [bacterium]